MQPAKNERAQNDVNWQGVLKQKRRNIGPGCKAHVLTEQEQEVIDTCG
jgi:hypothetical protein